MGNLGNRSPTIVVNYLSQKVSHLSLDERLHVGFEQEKLTKEIQNIQSKQEEQIVKYFSKGKTISNFKPGQKVMVAILDRLRGVHDVNKYCRFGTIISVTANKASLRWACGGGMYVGLFFIFFVDSTTHQALNRRTTIFQ